MPQNKNDFSAIVDRHKKLIEQYGYTDLALGWGPKKRQEIRLLDLAESWDLESKSILDVGSGLSDLYPLALKKGISKYQGIELVPEFVSEAKRRFATFDNFEVVQGNFLETEIDIKPDITILSGIFNSRFSNMNNHDYIVETIQKAYEISNFGCSANFLRNNNNTSSSELFYTDEIWLIENMKRFCNRYILKASQLPYEFSITLYKNSDIDINNSRYVIY
jgi:hypothetical protein